MPSFSGTSLSLLGAAAFSQAAQRTYTYKPLTDTSALCLDGSQYGYFMCHGSTNASWTISIQGGGWCYNEAECLERAGTALGSSKTWAAEAANMACPSDAPESYVQMYYC